MSDVRVLVIADDPLARAGLASLLATQAGLVVAGQVAGGTMLDGGPEWKQTDLVVWDLGWDPERGLEEMAQARLGSAPLVALVASEADGAAALALGARGALLRDTPPEALAKALVAVAHGHFHFENDRDQRSSPIYPDEVANASCDYLALGHWDRHADVSQGDVVAAYSGTPLGPSRSNPLGAVAVVDLDPATGVSLSRVSLYSLE